MNFVQKNKFFFLPIKRWINQNLGMDVIRYPNPELKRRIKLLQSNHIDVVLDIGANIGQYGSELRSIGYKGKIISFEPLSTAFKQLQGISKRDNDWDVYPIALGEENKQEQINVSINSVSSSIQSSKQILNEIVPDTKFVKTETIEVKTLDSIYSSLNLENKKVFMKIDTQGYEEMVLNGAKESLNKIEGIQIEMALIPSYENALNFDQMKQKINDLGFRLTAIENGFYDAVSGKQMEVDGIFFKQ